MLEKKNAKIAIVVIICFEFDGSMPCDKHYTHMLSFIANTIKNFKSNYWKKLTHSK